MIKIDVIAVGKMSQKHLTTLEKDYFTRINKYTKINMIEVKEANDNNINTIIEKEADNIISKIDKSSYVITMEIEGKQVTSEELAKQFNDIATYSHSKITFIIGGSYGLSPRIKSMSNQSLSFSKMTFPHQLFRVMLLEQVYRAFSINNNSPYHK